MENSEILSALKGVWYIATSDEDQPHVRPFDNVAEIDEKLYFGTAKNKRVFEQLIRNPKIEVFSMNDFGTCRFMAEAVLEENADLARKAFEEMEKPFDEENSAAFYFSRIRKA